MTLAARTMRPTVCRMVHMIDYGNPDGSQPCRAAVVLEVDEPGGHDATLKVLRPHGDRVEFHVPHVELDEENVRPRTWHWPERES